MLVWHIRQGHFGDVRLDGFNLLALAAFEGNLWAGAKARMGLFIDENADEPQRQALQTIFGGQAGGWPAGFAATIGEFRGVEFVPISFEIADDLAHWQAEIPGRVRGRADSGTGRTAFRSARPSSPATRPCLSTAREDRFRSRSGRTSGSTSSCSRRRSSPSSAPVCAPTLLDRARRRAVDARGQSLRIGTSIRRRPDR